MKEKIEEFVEEIAYGWDLWVAVLVPSILFGKLVGNEKIRFLGLVLPTLSVILMIASSLRNKSKSKIKT